MATSKHELQKCPERSPATVSHEHVRRVQSPAADVIERAEAFVVVADMPGVDEKSLDINVERNVLTIQGRAACGSVAGHDLVYAEYEPADFRRAFVLSDEVDVGKIDAAVGHGVLRVTLPKAEKAKPRQITVKAVG
jgi:HSP20 family protein